MSDYANLSALLEPAEVGSDNNPFRPTKQVLIQGVNRSLDFDRILSLPRRAEMIDPAIEAALNVRLRTDEQRGWTELRRQWWEAATGADGTVDGAFALVPAAVMLPEIAIGKATAPDKPQLSLRPIQARAIADAYNQNGLFAPIGVGHGKFLISILLITLIEDGRKAAGLSPLKWLLLVPANLIKQTHAELAKARRHWRVPKLWTQTGIDGGGIRVESYDKLSSQKAAKQILDVFAPDAVVADECHKLKRTSSGRTRKFMRYMTRDRPGTRFFGMSGSITRKTVRDYWHLIHLALPNHPPLPRSFSETEAWCQALDDAPDSDFRRAPGALLDLCDPDEIEALSPGWKAAPDEARLSYYGEDEDRQERLLEIVRKGYRRRLRETPGVVATTDGALGTSLVIAERIPPPVPQEVIEAFKKLRQWRTLNDDEIDGGVNLWRHACEIASGMWNKWDPVAPPAWLAARQDWNRFVRYVLAHNRQRLDTPLQVTQAVDADRLSDAFGDGKVFLEAWRAVKDTFEPNPQAQWISYWLVDDAIAWVDEQTDDDSGKQIPDRCIIWTNLVSVGDMIEARSGGRIKHFAGGAEASDKILTHKGPIVCSIQAHGTGKNLQRYDRNLVLHWPSGGDRAEQLLGRTHRPGQDADEVRVDVYMHALELRSAFDTSLRGADYIEKSTGATQKLTYANVTRRAAEDVAILIASNDPLWRK